MGFKPFTIDDRYQDPELNKLSIKNKSNPVAYKPIKEESKEAITKNPDGTISVDLFKLAENVKVSSDPTPPVVEKEKKPRRRTVKEQSGPIVTDGVNNESKRELNIIESNEPIATKYNETNNILRSAILEIDRSLVDIQNDIRDIRSSRTMRSKYTYLSNLQSGVANLLSTKIAAARELNNTIKSCNDFELKRYKEVQSVNAANGDEDANVMKMYQAFMSAPVSSNPLPNISATAINSGLSAGVSSVNIGNIQEAGFNSYVQNMTPQQHMMQLEHDPNIKEVVVYNQENGSRYFDIIDMRTGQHVPNTEPMDPMFLEDVTIDLKNKIARNVNLGESYPLIVVGQPILTEY